MKTRLGLLLAAICLFAASAAAQTLDVVHRFQSSGGAYGRLIQATDGDFYGTTSLGGTNGVGTIFKMDASGSLTTLHSFGYTEGANPQAALLQGGDGNFYGTASAGGTSNVGTVFKMDPAGHVTALHSFNGTDGAAPWASLIQAADGNFYGTTRNGGASGLGTVFKMDSAGNLTSLHSFETTTMATPTPRSSRPRTATSTARPPARPPARPSASATPASAPARSSRWTPPATLRSFTLSPPSGPATLVQPSSRTPAATCTGQPHLEPAGCARPLLPAGSVALSSAATTSFLSPAPSSRSTRRAPSRLLHTFTVARGRAHRAASSWPRTATSTGRLRAAPHIFRVSPAGSYETLHSLHRPGGLVPLRRAPPGRRRQLLRADPVRRRRRSRHRLQDGLLQQRDDALQLSDRRLLSAGEL